MDLNLSCPRKLLPKQAEIFSSKARYRLYSGAFRAGKSFLGCHVAITQCLKYPKNFWLLGSQTIPMLEDTLIPLLFDELELYQKEIDKAGGGIQLIRKWNEQKKRLIFFNKSKAIFRGLERSAEGYTKLKSMTLGGWYIDEPVDVTHDTFRMLQGRLSLPGVEHIGILGGNPSAKSNWVYKTFFKDHYTDPDYMVVNTTSLDNIYVPEDYILDIKKWETTDIAYYRRYVLGKWGSLEGQVYGTFDRDVHVIEPFKIPEEWERYRGIDFGYTNPFCCLWIARDHDHNYYVYDEHYQAEMLLSDHVDIIKQKTGSQRIINTFADPSGKQERMELDRLGISNVPADNEVMAGIQEVQKKLRVKDNKKPSLYIFNTCTNIISEMESYRWQVSRGVVNDKEMPLDKDNHANDSLRYIIFSLSQMIDPEIIGDLSDLTSPY